MPVEKKPITMTNSAMHMLAQCLADSGPCTPPAAPKLALAAKVWQRVRKAYSRVIAGHDLDDGQLAPKAADYEDGKDGVRLGKAWLVKAEAYGSALKSWADESATVELSNKHLECCREHVRWTLENRDKATVKFPVSPHTTSLLVAIGLADAETEDD
jgi:hypothetical protein